jgi:hypothetical protein
MACIGRQVRCRQPCYYRSQIRCDIHVNLSSSSLRYTILTWYRSSIQITDDTTRNVHITDFSLSPPSSWWKIKNKLLNNCHWHAWQPSSWWRIIINLFNDGLNGTHRWSSSWWGIKINYPMDRSVEVADVKLE